MCWPPDAGPPSGSDFVKQLFCTIGLLDLGSGDACIGALNVENGVALSWHPECAGSQFNFESVLGLPLGMELGPQSSGILDLMLKNSSCRICLAGSAEYVSSVDLVLNLMQIADLLMLWVVRLRLSTGAGEQQHMLDFVPGVGGLIAEPDADGLLCSLATGFLDYFLCYMMLPVQIE
ncbi:hypothetical protein Nepgr_031757 [Nepenthes gracilis]|uniref:Uncharacterized protein n=1 Tax=Nepenthes gracilis TaxID=150966 RepID=A0AAD3TIW4_NEPGR|nr:hypothetical protein Nepgr_031757 [Nepenthes gracilis]